MRTTILILVLIMAGCVSRPTLEELEDEALQTGNWEAVEHREKMMDKRGENDPVCPAGQVKYCVESGQKVECRCVPRPPG